MIGRRLQELRFEKRLTQEQVAKRLNLTPGAYGHYEVNRSMPGIDILIKLAKLFDCSVDYLLGLSKIKKPSSIESFDNLPEDARTEINNFINYVKEKYIK